jgi:hypothetical protein
MYQINAAVHKSFHAGDRMVVQSGIEFFNLSNHPNFSNPSGALGSVGASGLIRSNNFGISSTMLGQGLGSGGANGGFSPLYQIGGPRSIQLSLRLAF